MIILVLLELVLLTKVCKYIILNTTCTMCVLCACGRHLFVRLCGCGYFRRTK